MHTRFKHVFAVAILLTLLLSRPIRISHAQDPVTETPQAIQPPTPTEIIEAINALRLSYGLPALATHPILMQLAQRQADGIAAGLTGHWRPHGLTLGQMLIMEGYPLSGDLTQDGYRSENWIVSMTAQGAIDAWLSDDEHSNTMLSEYRSDIGAGVAMARDEWGQDQIYVAIETALQTRSGQQQSGARDFLTRLPAIINGTTSINGTPVPLTKGQYIIPVIKNTARPDGDVLHEVQYGQSLWSIAITYGTTIKQIQAWNNLGESNIVYERQMLLVQKGATHPTTPPTQTATTAFSRSLFLTPSPTVTQTETAAGISAPETGGRSSIVAVLIISVSLLMMALCLPCLAISKNAAAVSGLTINIEPSSNDRLFRNGKQFRAGTARYSAHVPPEGVRAYRASDGQADRRQQPLQPHSPQNRGSDTGPFEARMIHLQAPDPMD